MFLKKKRGFTLLELLVVIAIIGLLSTITVVSLNSARVKARDSKRVADLKSLQLALELYNQDNPATGYPESLGSLTESPVYIATTPKDPKTGLDYKYKYCNSPASGESHRSYHLGVVLETVSSQFLVDDSDAYNNSNLTGCGSQDFHGQSADCVSSSAGSPEQCYDLAR